MKRKEFIGVFSSVVKKKELIDYCSFYGLDLEAERKSLIKRGYTVKSI